jgi:uncharacterized protein (TIGR00290 family)
MLQKVIGGDGGRSASRALPCLYTMSSYPETGVTVRQILLSWSGGKDSALALQSLRALPGHDVVGLVTTVTRGYERISIHGVRRALLQAQAEALGLPLHTVELDPSSSNDAYEAAFLAGLASAKSRHPAASSVAFGDLFLEDVRAYRERLLAGTGWAPVFPLWGIDTAALARRFIDDGFVARLVCVDTTQLHGDFSGRVFDSRLLGDLPPTVDPCGERGEFHTFVSAGPGFRRAIPHEVGERVLRDERFMYCDLV